MRRGVMAATADEFSAFVADTSGSLYRTAYLLTGGDRHDAQDLVQDALVDTYARWETIRDPGSRQAFVRRVMVRKATRRWRRPPVAEVTTAMLPESTVTSHDAEVASSVDLTSALTQLSPKQRAVVVLRYYLDLSEADIAEALGCSTGAVKTHASRALKALGIALDPRPDLTQASTRRGTT